MSKSPFWASLLYALVRELRPTSGVELGTCVGISASYQGAAMQLNGDGRLISLEGSPEIARIATETLAELDIPNVSVVTGPFHDTLAGVLSEARPIDYFFNDGHHDHDAVTRYFEAAVSDMASDAVMVFDDISWSPGMRAAWTEITNDPRVSASIDLGALGIAMLGRADADRSTFRIPL